MARLPTISRHCILRQHPRAAATETGERTPHNHRPTGPYHLSAWKYLNSPMPRWCEHPHYLGTRLDPNQ
ncbi:hypothetical protein BDZ89DRAFT_147083 [Hymenopellis radicata]|nr:hypothetical protein BDZ89DRAFT_147083 [Hymenopellis radicata]